MRRTDQAHGRCAMMRRRRCALLFLLFSSLLFLGCVSPDLEKVREFNDDGVHLFRQGDYRHARECFEVALQMHSEDPSLLYNIGRCHEREGNAAKAEELYRHCLYRASNHAECRRALALLMLRSGRRAETDEMIEGWLASEPQLADAYAEDGWRLRQDGEVHKALGRFQQALQIEPQNVRALTELGILYELIEQPSYALEVYERALKQQPKNRDLAERVSRLCSQGVKSPRPN
jgi:tetratricopeptide (TPR) repeat protein